MSKCLWLFALATLIACGEAEEIVLPQKPDRALFTDVRDTLIKVGCSADGSGCHSVLVGDFKLGSPESDLAAIENEFQLTKALVDLESPGNSLILRAALRNDPLAIGHPICFDADTSCAFRRVVTWLSYETADDQTPDEVCDSSEVIENACFTL